jgi:hypothetical protein
MRDLNRRERELIEKMKNRPNANIKRLFEPKVQYQTSGNFVVAIVSSRSKLFTGVAKFNPTDKHFLPEVGERLAFIRAITKHSEEE